MSPRPRKPSSGDPFLAALGRLDAPGARRVDPSERRAPTVSLFQDWGNQRGPWEEWRPEEQARALECLELCEALFPSFLWTGSDFPALELPRLGLAPQRLPPACLASSSLMDGRAPNLAFAVLDQGSERASAAGWLSLCAQSGAPSGALEPITGSLSTHRLKFAVEAGAPEELLLGLMEGFGPNAEPLAESILKKRLGVSDMLESVAERLSQPAWRALLRHCRSHWSGPDGELVAPGLLYWNPLIWRLTQILEPLPSETALNFLREAIREHSALAPNPLWSLKSLSEGVAPWQRPAIDPLLAQAERQSLESELPAAPASRSPRI